MMTGDQGICEIMPAKVIQPACMIGEIMISAMARMILMPRRQLVTILGKEARVPALVVVDDKPSQKPGERVDTTILMIDKTATRSLISPPSEVIAFSCNRSLSI